MDGSIINIIFILVFLICWVLIIIRLVHTRFAPVKTIKAQIVDKYKLNTKSIYPKTFKGDMCKVVFKTKNKKLSFLVSQITFDNYKKGQKGTLKYKGNKIIDFK